MDREYIVLSSETLGTANTNTQWKQQIFTPELKQEFENDTDDENSSGSDYMLPQHFNYYDSKTHVLEQVKEELPGDEHPEVDCCTNNNKILPENNSLVNVKDEQNIENESLEASLDIKQENKDNIYEFTITLEADDREVIIDNAENTNMHCDVSVTCQKSQCKLYSKSSCVPVCTSTSRLSVLTILNHIITSISSNLLEHSSEQIKIEINTSEDNEMKDWHNCQYCSERFHNRDSMLAHVSYYHRMKYPKCELCGKQFKTVQGLKRHILKLHRLKLPMRVTRKNLTCTYCNFAFKNKLTFKSHMKLCHPAKKVTYKCGSCVKYFKTRYSLVVHMKRTHYNFGRMFKCWCGEQFHTPIHLSEHKSLQHTGNRNREKYKCKVCDAMFKSKWYLTIHVQRSHHDCERNTEEQSANHETRRHDRLSESTYKGKVQCDHCHRTFTDNSYLMKHMRRIHYDYGKVFRCWCGKEYRTPYHLKEHEGMHNYEKTKVQCDTCKRFYKNNYSLVKHKIKIHSDYGKVYDCWCGKEFRTPSQLTDHIIQEHGSKDNSTNNDKVHCVKCNRFFKNRNGLLRHIIGRHQDYNNKVFKSSSEEEIHTKSDDKKQQHNSKITEINNGKLHCVKCKSFFKNRDSLQRHIMGTDHDYDIKVYRNWCSSEIHTPSKLADNKDQQKNSINEILNKDIVQCVKCKTYFKNRTYLYRHIRRVHHDYGSKVFSCWCGKVFRTPYKLTSHKSMSHDGKNDGALATRVQCDVCKKFYKSNRLLERHCKRMHCDYLFE